jgi:hypothetical protein
MDSCVASDDAAGALLVYARMIEARLRPTAVTYTILMTVCLSLHVSLSSSGLACMRAIEASLNRTATW